MSKSCPKCGGALKEKYGRNGPFLGCSSYPNCKYTSSIKFGNKNTYAQKNKSEDPKKHPWVNASSIGSVEFCPQSHWLNLHGVEQNEEAEDQMEEGNYEHARVSHDRRCYIATYAFGEAHPVVAALRQWRDQVLLKTWHGKAFVFCYYKISPWLIVLFGRFKLFNKLAKHLVIKIAKFVGVQK